jgi:hypothetical protein
LGLTIYFFVSGTNFITKLIILLEIMVSGFLLLG